MIDSDVNITNGLGMSGVCFEYIVACIDMIEVDVLVEQNVEPQAIGEVRAILSDNKVILSFLDINEIVGFESQSEGNVRVEYARVDGVV